MVSCENCGADAPRLKKYRIEGCVMSVCQECAKYGVEVKEVRKFVPKAKSKRPEEVVVENAGQVIKAAREKMGMRQVDLAKMLLIKESLIHNIETGHLPLSLPLAKKFEENLDIKLIEEDSD